MQTDENLVTRARAGDPDAFCSLVARYERLVIATASGLLGSVHEARDVAQEAFLAAYQKLNDLRCPRKFGAWVLQITRREALKERGRIAARKAHPLAADVEDFRPASEDHDTLLRAARLVARLPKQEQVVVGLRYFGGLTTAEIAEVCGRPAGTVRTQLSRGLQRLKRYAEHTNHD